MRLCRVVFKKCPPLSNVSLFKVFLRPFNVENYHTPLNTENISRHHMRFRYDENNFLSKNEDLQEEMLSKEKATFDNVSKTFQSYTDYYYKRSNARKDLRTKELPERYDNYTYTAKFSKLGTNDYEIIYRKDLRTNKEELVLDLKDIPMVHKRFHKTVKLAKMAISDDHQFVSFLLDLENNEKFTLGIKDTQKNQYLNIRIPDCSNMVFGPDNSCLFYVKYDEKRRSDKVFRRDLKKTSGEEDELIFQEKDEQFYVDISKSKDGKYLFISTSSKEISEIYAVKRGEPTIDSNKLMKLISREKKCRANAVHAEDSFFLLTDLGGVFDYKIMSLKDKDAQASNFSFSDYYIPKPGETLKEIDLFKNHMVLYLEQEGLSLITVIELKTKASFNIDLQEPLAVISPGLNENYDSESFRFHVDSPFVYNQIYEYNIPTRSIRVLEGFKMDGPPINKNNFVMKRLSAPSKDGEEIPVTIIHKKTLRKDRKNKLLLHGYGAYGLPMEIGFNIVYLSALENDWIIAYAHVRGGNEKGWTWHKSAMKERKMNSFFDFISCAEFLVAEGYTHPSMMCAYGASAGGLLVGTVINLRPNLFKAVVLSVPFLDVLSCLCDKDLPLSVADYEEFGNPLTNQRIFDLIRSYSPYENIGNHEYPFIYISMGEEDFRIPNWSVLKYVKRFRERSKKSKVVEEICEGNILVNPVSGGHHGENSTVAGIRQKSSFLGLLDFIIAEKSKDVKIE